MKLLLVSVLLALPAAAKKELTWHPAIVESSFRQTSNGLIVPYERVSAMGDISVRESIYLDAGEWLYHVSQIVHLKGTLNLRDGARVEVAEDGKQLVLRIDGKERRLKIEERSRGKKGAVIR